MAATMDWNMCIGGGGEVVRFPNSQEGRGTWPGEKPHWPSASTLCVTGQSRAELKVVASIVTRRTGAREFSCPASSAWYYLVPGGQRGGCNVSRFARDRFQPVQFWPHTKTHRLYRPTNKICPSDCPWLLTTCWRSQTSDCLVNSPGLACTKTRRNTSRSFEGNPCDRNRRNQGRTVPIKMWLRRLLPTAVAASGLMSLLRLNKVW